MRTLKLSWTELAAGMLLGALLLLMAIPGVGQAWRARTNLASCQQNLKQLGIAFKMFTNESRGGSYPPRSPYPGNWIVDARWLWPEYLSDLSVFMCPASPLASEETFRLQRAWGVPGARPGMRHPECVSSLYYVYTGFNVNSDEQALALYLAWEADPKMRLAGRVVLPLPQWSASDWRPPGQGVPVLWDRPAPDPRDLSHQPAGLNVLHMDGSVNFVPYSPLNASSNFPATLLSAELFGTAVPQLPALCR